MDSNVRFINIEYVFNRLFDLYLWIKYIVLFQIGGENVNEYLASKQGIEYDGLRDRFNIAGGGPTNGTFSHAVQGNSFIDNLLGIFGGNGSANVAQASNNLGTNGGAALTFLSGIRDLMTIIALIVITFYIYSTIRLKEVSAEYEAAYNNSYKQPKAPEFKNTKWSVVEAHMNSGNEAEWRLAILEADNMLADMLKTLSLEGRDVGEKLTNANRGSFTTLEDAWEAHKVRNRIAHDGSDYVVTEHLARKTISQFKNVFEEFKFGLE